MSLYKTRTALDSVQIWDVVQFQGPQLWTCVNNALSIVDGFNYFVFVGTNDPTNVVDFTNSPGAAARIFCNKVGTIAHDGRFEPDHAP